MDKFTQSFAQKKYKYIVVNLAYYRFLKSLIVKLMELYEYQYDHSSDVKRLIN
ncbi:hypothetical protein FHT21_001206 [Pedobacter sp. SG908]|nr:hypothetical protein [Pedobacter sp. SG908]NMN36179.1 hypothetical protein [Pedobacter sp. SG918]